MIHEVHVIINFLIENIIVHFWEAFATHNKNYNGYQLCPSFDVAFVHIAMA